MNNEMQSRLHVESIIILNLLTPNSSLLTRTASSKPSEKKFPYPAGKENIRIYLEKPLLFSCFICTIEVYFL